MYFVEKMAIDLLEGIEINMPNTSRRPFIPNINYVNEYDSGILDQLTGGAFARFRNEDNKKSIKDEMFDKLKDNVLPKEINALKEWSISARALKNVIDYALCGNFRYDYKFGVVFSNRYRICRVWNCKTNNVICTIKDINKKIIIRYRPNSYYASVMASYNNTEIKNPYNGNRSKIIAIPSNNLHLHRENSSSITNRSDASMEAQIGFRKARLKKFINDKLAKENEKGRQRQW